ncbi:sensor histidine kinase [Nonomuraea sp. NPDC048826]|uniref:sensor histidine kinase n=1 Tax=Nonomuraea sp. NPDC048826 TaxID=3364347 RepID=UPI00371D0AFA
MRWNRILARRWTCLILGGALLMPYMMAGVLVSGWVRREATALLLLPVQLGVFAAVLPVVALTGLFLPVRGLEVHAAQGLLGAAVEVAPQEGRRSWQERRRTAAWYTLHLAVGGVASGCTLAVVPFTAVTMALPFTGASDVLGVRVAPGWTAIGWPAAGLAALVLLVALVAGSGGLLARLAPVLLGPTPAERLAAAEERARDLARRNRLARELHDSVGHALSVVTLQAAAAGRVLDHDPETARTALAAIEGSARAALEDLDHVLGVLRAGEGRDRAPGATLSDLDTLARSTGAEVRQDVGDLSAVPALVSREAYRIVQEALTNAVKHGHGPIHLSAHVRDGALDLLVTNRTGARNGPGRTGGPGGTLEQAGSGPGRTGGRKPDETREQAESGPGRTGGRRPDETREQAESGPRSTGGRGLDGMRERAGLLGGEVAAGPHQGGWRVAARLPLRSEP